MLKTIIYIIVVSPFAFLQSKALATCSGYKAGATTSITLPASISVSRNAKVGDVLYTVNSPAPTNPLANCNQNLYSVALSNKSYTLSGLSLVYETGVPGIGFQITRPQHYSSSPMLMDMSVQDQIQARISYGGQWINWGFKLIVTGPVSSGSTAAFQNPVVTSYMSGSLTSITDWGNLMNRFNINGTTKINVEKGCNVNDYSKKVVLPEVNLRSIRNTPGKYPDSTEFKIVLACTAETKVSAKFDGTTMPGTSNVLLNQSARSTTAGTSVGVQLMKDQNVISMGQSFIASESADAEEHLLFNAYYFYNGGTDIQGGDVNAAATFTLTYQ